MKREIILIICIGILLVVSVIADVVLTPSDSIIPYTKDEKKNVTDAGLLRIDADEVQCNADSCWCKIEYNGMTDWIGLQGVSSSSNENDIQEARDNSIKRWVLKKAQLINDANLNRNDDSEIKLPRGCIGTSVDDCAVAVVEEPK